MRNEPSPRWCKDVKHQLIERDMDVNDLAEAIGISRVYVSEIINGRRYAPDLRFPAAFRLRAVGSSLRAS